jgi:hypothetical protein
MSKEITRTYMQILPDWVADVLPLWAVVAIDMVLKYLAIGLVAYTLATIPARMSEFKPFTYAEVKTMLKEYGARKAAERGL